MSINFALLSGGLRMKVELSSFQTKSASVLLHSRKDRKLHTVYNFLTTFVYKSGKTRKQVQNVIPIL